MNSKYKTIKYKENKSLSLEDCLKMIAEQDANPSKKSKSKKSKSKSKSKK